VTNETAGTFRVNVTATSVGNTSVFDYVNTTTTVEEIEYGVDLIAPANKTTLVNVNATYKIVVNNTGNVRDTFNLSVNNLENAAVANLSTYQVTLDAGANTTVLLNVTDETPGTYNVSVYAESVKDPSANDTVVIMTTVVTAPYSVNLTVEPIMQIVRPGENATYILTVENTGTEMDNYTLNITYNETTAWLNRTSITNLAPGATQDVLLNVSSLTPGIFVVNVTVNSTTDPNSTDTISTITRVVPPINITAFAVDPTVGRGQILNASVTIRNEGSSAINVTVVVGGLQNETGYPIVGTGVLVNLGAGQEMKLPVLVYVPATADIGNYTLFAVAWLYEDYPDVTKAIRRGPEVTSVTP